MILLKLFYIKCHFKIIYKGEQKNANSFVKEELSEQSIHEGFTRVINKKENTLSK